eukprot:Sro54_g032000.2  (202) ;mRNA; r:108246-108851
MVSGTQIPWPTRTAFHPTAKLSSWCRQRKPLEDSFKKEGIGEVLMVQPSSYYNDIHNHTNNNIQWEILEGITSNAFFVYKGGILRTAASNVLPGSARHLVLLHARSCGLTVQLDNNPVTLGDCQEWQEVFITSAVRIIVPVQQLLVPRYDEAGLVDNNKESEQPILVEPLWSYTPSRDKNEEPYWRRLLETIVTDRLSLEG